MMRIESVYCVLTALLISRVFAISLYLIERAFRFCQSEKTLGRLTLEAHARNLYAHAVKKHTTFVVELSNFLIVLLITVAWVTHQRISHKRRMFTNLMLATCYQMKLTK